MLNINELTLKKNIGNLKEAISKVD